MALALAGGLPHWVHRDGRLGWGSLALPVALFCATVGALSLVEMRKLLRTLGLPLDHSGQEMLKGYFNKADEDQSGSMDFAEFLVLMSLLTTVNFAGIDQAAQDVLDKATTFDASRGVEKVLTAPRRAVSVPRRAVFEEGKSAL